MAHGFNDDKTKYDLQNVEQIVADVSGRINEAEGRINNFIDSQKPSEVVMLWSGTHGVSDTITLSQDVSGFDFLDFHIGGAHGVIRVPAVNNTVQCCIPNIRNEGDENWLKIYENVWTISGNTITPTQKVLWSWSGDEQTVATIGQQTDTDYTNIARIDGVKLIEAASQTELEDLRIGANGTTYTTAGSAVRDNLLRKVNSPTILGAPYNGLSGQVLSTNGDGTTSWIDPQTPEVAIDDTLTKNGKAADAKATGDAINNFANVLGDKIDSVENDMGESIENVEGEISDLKSAISDIASNNILFRANSVTVTGTRYAYRDIFTLTDVDVTKQYTLHVDNVTGAISSSYAYIRCLDASDDLISQRGSGQTVPVNFTVTPPTATKSIVFRLYASAGETLPGEAVYSGIEIYEGSNIEITLNNDLRFQRLDDDEADIKTLKYDQSKTGNIAYTMASQGLYSEFSFVQGSITSSGDHDTDVAARNRARTAHVPVKKGYKIISQASVLSPVYRWYIWKYDTNGDWTGTVGVTDIREEYGINFDGSIRITISKRDESNFTNDDLITLNEHITVLSVSALNILEYGEQLGDIVSGADAVPSYWVDDLNSDISKIQMLDAQIGTHGDSFVFITDTHIESNAMVSPVLISSILKKTSVDKVVHGGDVFQSDYTKSGAIAKLYSYFSQMHNANRYYQVRGNHDINDSIDGVSSDEYLTDSEYYGVCVKRSADYIINPDCNPYYYFDNEVQKIRYFVLDTGSRTTADVTTYFNTQLTWMENLINALDNTWGIVVLLHIMFTPKLSSDTSDLALSNRGTLLKAKLDSLYGRQGKPQIICVVCGHVHRDFSMISDVGYPIIATACDTGTSIATDYDPVNTDRTQGTTNEQLFDVCHINKATRTINMTRIGAGEDRTFTF